MNLPFCALMAHCLASFCSAQSNKPIRWQEGASNADRIMAYVKEVKTITLVGPNRGGK
jgi:hypothetical protein